MMIKVHENKDKSIHGTYKCKDMTLKLHIENKKSIGEELKNKVEIFREGDEGTLVFSSNYKSPHTIKLEKENDFCKITLTKYLIIKKEHMTQIEELLLAMSELSNIDDVLNLPNSSSSTNLLDPN